MRKYRAVHSNLTSLIVFGALIAILALIMYYLSRSAPKWYHEKQDVVFHVFVNDSNVKQALALEIDDETFTINTSKESIQRFHLSLRPKRIRFALKTVENEIIRIDSMQFSGADNVHYYIRALGSINGKIIAEVEAFEFYPI